MSWRTNLFSILRRRRAGVGRFVLAWFALASASASAGPCFAMASTVAPGAYAAAPMHHDRASPDMAAGHDHSHANAHDHHDPSATEQPLPSQDPPSPCTHCQLSFAMAGGSASSHALCSAADNVAEGGKSSAQPIAFKTIPPAPIVVLVPVDPRPTLIRGKLRPPDCAAASLRLNLRHCVFLI
jgi:hypothetical protein